MKIIFASQNQNKVKEIQHLVGLDFQILSLTDLEFYDEIEEYGLTLEENACIKSRFIYENFKTNCIADDTGLIVDELNGEPGVKSARYAGEEKDPDKNIDLLLCNLKNKNNRKAKFVTVISLIIDDKEYQFTGELEGTIANEKKGDGGFGYDPVFIPLGKKNTLAELTLEEKNKISHRAIAFNKLRNFLLNSGF